MKLENIKNMPVSEFAEKYVGLELLPYQKVYLDFLQTHHDAKIRFSRCYPKYDLYTLYCMIEVIKSKYVENEIKGEKK